MITLITGGPGTGKTAWLVSQLMILQAQQPHRRLFSHGIKEFKLSHKQIFCRNPNCEMCSDNELVRQSLKYSDVAADEFNKEHDLYFVEDWPIWKSPYDLIVIDEAQRAWKSKAGTVLDSISLLDTHRHSGVDFWLLTQHPKLLHIDVRVMITRHIHLKSAWNGRRQYEWSEVSENVQSTSDAVERPYSLPKHVYNFYKSAEIHTKQDKRKPISFYATIGFILFAVILSFFVFNRIKSRVSASQQSAIGVPAVAGEPVAVAPASLHLEPNQGVSFDTPELAIRAMTPTIEGLPWTAPVYRDLAKPVSMPIVHGCVEIRKPDDDRCQCYSQQGTIIDMPRDVCRSYVKHHAFNHFKVDTGKENLSDESLLRKDDDG